MFCVSWSIMKDRNAAWGERPITQMASYRQVEWRLTGGQLRSDQTNFIENLCQTAQAE
jgi:hypothetical protein